MSTGKKSFAEQPNHEQGQQRESSLKKVIGRLPARSKDNFLLLALLVLGLSGLAYILSLPLTGQQNKLSLFDKIFHSKNEKALTADFIKSNLLEIKGDLMANMPTIFSFNGLDVNEKYQINFGDKVVASVDSNMLNHTYTKPGTFKIELKKERQGQLFVVHCEFVCIK